MLERLDIENFAVARSVSLRPGPGLSVFTGETGAGKSLIVDALAFVFGARRGREVVAAGADRATVTAVLRLPETVVEVERSVGLSGRSSLRIDRGQRPLEAAQRLAERCLDLHGQSEQLALLQPAVQLRVLDRYAGSEADATRFAALARELRDVRRTLQTIAAGARERERRIEQLRFEVEEISGAALQPGEDDGLRLEHARLSSTARRLEDAEAALASLGQAPLGDVLRAISGIAARDEGAAPLADSALLLEATAADLARALRNYRDDIEDDPGRLAAVVERLDLIARLRRKYGATVEDVCAYGRSAADELAGLTAAGVSVEALESREAEVADSLAIAGTRLSRARREAAVRLVEAVSAELGHLGMGGASLAVGFACEDDSDGVPVPLPDYEVIAPGQPPGPDLREMFRRAFSESGFDRATMLASFNPGSPARPLASVASGGEASRFLLAMTAVFGASAEPRVVVLDEVDEGVGGRTGRLVGEALARLAARHQVLCVTHLPQVAAFGSRHFVVTKETDGSKTWSEIREVEGEERVDELASMLGGVSAANRVVARELIESAAGAERAAN